MFDVLVAALPRYVLAASGFRPGGTPYSPEGDLVNRATLTNLGHLRKLGETFGIVEKEMDK